MNEKSAPAMKIAPPDAPDAPPTIVDDVCALPLARRMAALLDRDPSGLHDGDPLPRGWHTMLFNLPTRQSSLRSDGAAELGVALPDIGLPRLMLGGRSSLFASDIPIGARVRRVSRCGAVQMKHGRSGRFALVRVEHRIFVDGAREAAVIDQQDYVLREAPGAAPESAAAAPVVSRPEGDAVPVATRVIVPDTALLFRYSAITDNPHRIHYDLPYATGLEGYPALVVNGSIPALFLLEMLRAAAGREPNSLASRNLAPMYCGQPLTLNLSRDGPGWRLWAHGPADTITFEARAQ